MAGSNKYSTYQFFDDPEVKVEKATEVTTPAVEEVSDTPYQKRKFKYNDYYNTYLKKNPKANKRKYAKWYESDEGVAARKEFEAEEERKYQEWLTKWKAQEERKKATPPVEQVTPSEEKKEETLVDQVTPVTPVANQVTPVEEETPVVTDEEVFVEEEEAPQAFDATTLHSYFSSPEQIKNWQKMNGLPETGVMDEASINQWNELQQSPHVAKGWIYNPETNMYTNPNYKSPKQLKEEWMRANPQPRVRRGNTSDSEAYSIWDSKYRYAKQNNWNSDGWKMGWDGSYKTADELIKNDSRFRKPRSVDTVVIDGKMYKVIVPTESTGKNYNRSYAYDPSTGKLRRLKESLLGIPNQFWEDGYDWQDVETVLEKRTPLVKPEDYKVENAKVRGVIMNEGLTFTDKKGGRLIKMTNSYQNGGQVPQAQQITEAVKQLVVRAMEGDKEAAVEIEDIIKKAQAGDQQAIQIAQIIKQEMEAIQKAKLGAKLNYIKTLKGSCSEDEELVYFQKGGKVCSKCEKKHKEVEKINKPSNNAVEEFKKGRRMKKCQEGGSILQQPVKKQIGANRIVINGNGEEKRYWTDGTVSRKYPIEGGKKTIVMGRDARTIGVLHGNRKQHGLADSMIKTDFAQKFGVPELDAKQYNLLKKLNASQ